MLLVTAKTLEQQTGKRGPLNSRCSIIPTRFELDCSIRKLLLLTRLGPTSRLGSLGTMSSVSDTSSVPETDLKTVVDGEVKYVQPLHFKCKPLWAR